MLEIDATLGTYLEAVWERGASDLLLVNKSKPLLRIDGMLGPMEDAPELDGEEIDRMVRTILRLEHREILERNRQVDFSFTWRGRGRFRGNAFRMKSTTAVSLRAIPDKIPQLEELGAPEGIKKLLGLPYGLVIV